MINIQLYIDKLGLLKEWIDGLVDNQPIRVWIDIQVCSTEWYLRNNLSIPQPYQIEIRNAYKTFEEYYNQQIKG